MKFAVATLIIMFFGAATIPAMAQQQGSSAPKSAKKKTGPQPTSSQSATKKPCSPNPERACY